MTGSGKPLTATGPSSSTSPIGGDRGRGVGQEDLARLGQGDEAGGQVHHRAVVVAVPVEDLARGQADADRRQMLGPGEPGGQCPCDAEAVGRVVGHEHDLVADQLHDLAAVGQDQVAHVLVEGIHDPGQLAGADPPAQAGEVGEVGEADRDRGQGGGTGVVHGPGPAGGPGQVESVQRAEHALDLRQHHPGDPLVAVHHVQIRAPGLEKGDLEAQTEGGDLGFGDPVERAADDPQGLEHRRGAEELPGGGVEAQDLELVGGERRLVVVTDGDAHREPDAAGLGDVEFHLGGRLRRRHPLDAPDVHLGGQARQVDLSLDALLGHAALQQSLAQVGELFLRDVADEVPPSHRS